MWEWEWIVGLSSLTQAPEFDQSDCGQVRLLNPAIIPRQGPVSYCSFFVFSGGY